MNFSNIYFVDTSSEVLKCFKYNTKLELSKRVQIQLGNYFGRVIRVKKDPAVKIKMQRKDSGGEMQGFKNTSELVNVAVDLKTFSTTYYSFFQRSSTLYPRFNSKISAIAHGLNLLTKIADDLMGQLTRLNPGDVLHMIVNIRDQLKSLQRRSQVLGNAIQLTDNMSIEGQPTLNLNMFQHEIIRVRDRLHFETIRNPVVRILQGVSVELKSDLCMSGLCFQNVKSEILFVQDQGKCEESFNLSDFGINKDQGLILIVSKANMEKDIEGILNVKSGAYLYYLIEKNGDYRGWFNATLNLYEKEHIVTVHIKNNTMEFQVKIVLLDTDVDLLVTSKLDNLRKNDPLLFVIDGKMSVTAGFFPQLISYLKDYINSKILSISTRIENSRTAFNLSRHQLTTAMKSVITAKKHFSEAKRAYDTVLSEIRLQKSKYRSSKLALEARLASKNNTINDYIKGIEECSPKLCIAKCIPGEIATVCHEERYVHKVQSTCFLVEDSFTKIVKKEVQQERSYERSNPVTSCRTRCPPLTGFIRKIFGRRRRALIGTIATIIVKAVGKPLFGYLGGEAGEMGAKIGSMLPGPLGIIGMFVGGIIGSAFGSCDKLCKTSLIPETIHYVHYEVEDISVTVPFTRQMCDDNIVQVKAGFEHGYECWKPSNCSDKVTDVECLNQNQKCHVIREHLTNRINSERDLGKFYDEYVQASLNIEALESRKSVLSNIYKNTNQTLKLTEEFVQRADAALKLANQSLENIKTVLASEISMKAYVDIYGHNLFKIKSGKYKFYFVRGSEVPKSLPLNMQVQIGTEQPYLVTTLLKLDSLNESIADTAMDIVKAFFHSNVRKRVRRNLETSNQLANSTEELLHKSIRSKCSAVEKSMLYILEVVSSFTKGIQERELSRNVLSLTEQRKKNFTTALNNTVTSYSLCNSTFIINGSVSENSSYSCSVGLLSAVYGNLTNDILTKPEVTSWRDKRSQIIATLENLTQSENFSDCSGLRDCVAMSFENILELINADNSEVGMKTKNALPQWRNALKELLNNEDLPESQTKSLTEKTTLSMKESHPNTIFCGEKPIIIRDLLPTLSLTENSQLNLSVEVAHNIHQITFIWRKNGGILKSYTSSNLLVDKASLSDKGIYTCEIRNRFGKTASAACNVHILRLPTFSMHPDNAETSVHSPIFTSTTCNATGIPYPNITWMYAPFHNASAYVPIIDHHNSNRILQLSNFKSNQSGLYYCVAANEAGSVFSSPAKVQVLDTSVATFPMRIVFSFQILSTLNISLSNNNNETADPAANATNNSSTQEIKWLPQVFSSQEETNLKTEIAKRINISTDLIIDINYSRQTKTSGLIGFTLDSNNLTDKLHSLQNESWNYLAEDVTMARKEVLLQVVWLHYMFKNISSQLKIGDATVVVDADTMQSDPLTEKCPESFRRHTNGFICGK